MADPVIGTPDHRPSPLPSVGTVILLVVVAATAVGSLLAYRGPSAATDTDPSIPVPSTTLPEPSPEASPAPGIPGSKSRVVTLEGTADGLEVVNWSPHALARATETTPDIALSLDYDVSLDWAATVRSTLRGRFLQVLLPGVFEPRWFVPASERVSSFAWHATEPGRLAWIAGEPGEEPMLWVGDAAELLYRQGDPDGLTVVPRGSALRAWGDWGFALAGAEGGVSVLDPSGRMLAERGDVSLLGVGAGGRILVRASSEWLLMDRSLPEEAPALQTAEWIVWAADGERLAAVDQGGGRIRIRIVETRTGRRLGETTVEAPFVLGEHLRWTGDDFLIGHRSGSLDLLIIDPGEARVEILEREGRTGTLWGLWVERVSDPSGP